MIVNKKAPKLFLVIVMMLAMVFPTSVFAANGDLTSIDFDTSEKEIHLTVTETTRQLRVLATIEGSTQKKDVTNDATWTSSSTKTVKVEGGLLTPLDKGTATITAKYKGAIATIKVISNYAAEEFVINQPKEVEYKLGQENIEVKALADGTNDVTSEAVWSSSDEGVVTVDKGKLKLIGRGNATITATYKGLSASFKVKVISPYEKLVIDPALKLEWLVGDKAEAIKVYARTSDSEAGLGTDVTDKAELKSSDNSVAKIVDGMLEPVALGKATITATYLGNSASIDVYVRNPFEALILDETEFIKNPLLFLNETKTIKASVRNAVGDSQEATTATWTSSNPLAVTVDNGKLTARAKGTSNIKVSYLGISKEFSVTVLPTVTEFTTEESEVELLKDESESVPKVTGTLLDQEKQDFSKHVQWTTSDEEVATVDDGKIKAKAKGEAVLTGKIGSKEVVEVKVIVNEKVLVLLPDIEEYQIVTGKSVDLPQVTAVLENGDEEKNVEVEWSLTGSTAVIKDNQIKGLVRGSTVLKGTYLNQSIKIPVVVEQEIVKIIVDPTTIELNIKRSKSIKATGYYANGKTVTLSSKMNWVSSDPTVVTTSRSSVKAVSEGTATVSGSYQGIDVSVKVNVVPKLTKLIASEKKLNLVPGDIKTVNLTAEYDTGNTSNVTGSAQWSSSNTSVAKVTNGKIEAKAKGSTRIKAKLGTKTVTITVNVK